MQENSQVTMPCCVCGTPVDLMSLTYQQRYNSLHGKRRVFCSDACRIKVGNVWTEERRELSRRLMLECNAKYASERMRKNNPAKRPEIQEKISKRMKEIGHKPFVRGGNGTGETVPQIILMEELEHLNPISEYAIPTKIPRGNGFPTCYKVDIAIQDPMVAIEIDGNSHCPIARQKQDSKKNSLLNTLGWTVLRFSNKQVMEHTEDCVQTVVSTISKLKETITTSQLE